MNNFLNFVKEHIIIIIIIILLIIVILSIVISPWFLLVLLPLLPLIYIANKNRKFKNLFSLLDKYKPKKKIIGSNDNILQKQIDQYVTTYIENILDDYTISKVDMDFLLELLKIKIKNEYYITIDIKKHMNEIADKKLKELHDLTNEEKEKEKKKKNFVEYNSNIKIDVYALSDNIKEYFKYDIDEEIINKFPEVIQKDIYYLKDLLQVIDDIKALGTTYYLIDADSHVLEELQERSKNKEYRMIYDSTYYTDHSAKFYNYINNNESFYNLYKPITDMPYENLKDYKNDDRYVTCAAHSPYLGPLPSIECVNSRDPLNYKFYFDLKNQASNFQVDDNMYFMHRPGNDNRYKPQSKEPEFIPTPDNAVPNVDNVKDSEKPFYTKRFNAKPKTKFNTETPETLKPKQENKPTTFTLKKNDFIISTNDRNNIETNPKTCPVYSILDTQLSTDKKECKINIQKIHPNKNLGCIDLATQVTQRYNKNCHFGSGN